MSTCHRTLETLDLIRLLQTLRATVNTVTRTLSCHVGGVVWEIYPETNRVITLCDGQDPIVWPLTEVMDRLGFVLPPPDVLWGRMRDACVPFGCPVGKDVYRFD